METRRRNSAPASLQHAIDVDPREQNINQSDISTAAGSSSRSVQNMNKSGRSTGSDSSSVSQQIMNQNEEHAPSLDLILEKNKENHKLCLDLQKAAEEGDVDKVKRLFSENSELMLLSQAITDRHETVLHVASGANQTDFVKEMIKLEPDNLISLRLKNKDGNTAFCFAAMAGSMEVANTMLDKDLSLLKVRGGENMTPVFLAALFGQREMASFLYDKTREHYENELTAMDKKAIFFVSIDTTLYDLALNLLDDDKENDLAVAYYSRGTEPSCLLTPLHPLAQTPLHLLDQTNKSEKMTLSTQALQLVERLWEKILEKVGAQVWNYFHKHKDLLFDAAHLGNFKFVAKLIGLYPDLVHQLDDNGRSIFHIAVMHRHASLFDLIYEEGFNKQLIATYLDKDNNSLLHLAAKYPHPRPASMVPGVALEMQRELRIFKEIELLVKPSYRELKNKEGKTPRELFTIEHADLLKQGEDWMRNTASQCMLVATIIATVVFAATFSVPGGNNDKEGLPIHRGNIVFRIFAVAEAIALSFSSISIIIFLSILTSRYAENDFLTSLPLKLVGGIIMLSVSIATMMLAFMSSFFLAYNHNRSNAVPIIDTVLVFLPVFVFGQLQYSLLRDVLNSSFNFRFSTMPRNARKLE